MVRKALLRAGAAVAQAPAPAQGCCCSHSCCLPPILPLLSLHSVIFPLQLFPTLPTIQLLFSCLLLPPAIPPYLSSKLAWSIRTAVSLGHSLHTAPVQPAIEAHSAVMGPRLWPYSVPQARSRMDGTCQHGAEAGEGGGDGAEAGGWRAGRGQMYQEADTSREQASWPPNFLCLPTACPPAMVGGMN